MEKRRSLRTAAKRRAMLHYRTSRSATKSVSALLLHHFTQSHRGFVQIVVIEAKYQPSVRWGRYCSQPPGHTRIFIPLPLVHSGVLGRSSPIQLYRLGDSRLGSSSAEKHTGSWWAPSEPESAVHPSRLHPELLQGWNLQVKGEILPLFSTGVATARKQWPALGYQTQGRPWQTRWSSTVGHQDGWGLQHTTLPHRRRNWVRQPCSATRSSSGKMLLLSTTI